MGFRIITIPFELNKMEFSEDELNKFIVNKKINSYKAEFFQSGGAVLRYCGIAVNLKILRSF